MASLSIQTGKRGSTDAAVHRLEKGCCLLLTGERHGRIIPRPRGGSSRRLIGLVRRAGGGFVSVAARFDERLLLRFGGAETRSLRSAIRSIRTFLVKIRLRIDLKPLPPRAHDPLVHIPRSVIVHPRQIALVDAAHHAATRISPPVGRLRCRDGKLLRLLGELTAR